MKFELEKNNNSRKLIIGISIIFCTVILILGMTFAYFTQSDSKNMDSLLTADIRDTLIYTDNTKYMRQGLIPAKEEVVKQAYAIEGDKKCIDSNGYSACSVYQFNIKNVASVSQELIIDMAPTVNTFTNLYFMLYEIDENGNSGDPILTNQIDKLTNEIIQSNNIPTYKLKKKLTLNPDSNKTYELVFFVNDTETDQTLEDAGKQFGASIKISSVTTGKYMVESFGTNCWETELLSDGTYKLTEFYGIDDTFSLDFNTEKITYGENFGEIDEACTGYVNDYDEDGFYSVYVPSKIGNKEISTLGNTLFSSYSYNEKKNEEKLRLSVTKINNIKMEEGIKIIEDGCAYDCSETQSYTFSGIGTDPMTGEIYEKYKLNISFPNTLQHIGDYAFRSSYINDNITIPNSVTSIGNNAFYGNENLTTLTFEEGSNLTTIGNNAFHQNNISSLTIPNSVTTIGDNAFYENNISSLTIPNSVTTIGDSAFSYNKNLTTLTFEEGNELTSIGNSVFSGNNISSLTIPASVTSIGDSAFSGNNISSLTIPNSVTSIGNYAFSGNENLTTLTFEEGSKLTTIGDSAFSNNNISSLTIPNSVTSIGNSAFSSNRNITTLIFEEADNNSGELTIGHSAFNSTNIKTLTISSRIKQNIIFLGSNIETLIFFPGVTTIGDRAFYQNNISSLTIPASVTTIGDSAFSHNTNLTTITFEEGSKLTTIGNIAFSENNISSLTIPNSVTTIGNSAFSNNNISSLIIPNSVTTIGNYAFQYNQNLTTLTFEEGSELTSIGNYAFEFCALDYQNESSPLYLPNNEFTTMGQSAFGDNPNLKYIYYEGDTTGFGYLWNGNATLLPRRN